MDLKNLFVTLDLTAQMNHGRSNTPRDADAEPPWGAQLAPVLKDLPGGEATFLGIPFSLPPWSDESAAWIVLQDEPVTVPVDAAATYVVFAHFCDAERQPPTLGGDDASPLLTDLPTRRRYFAAQPGERLADYVLVYADGTQQRQAIRRRFEIGAANQNVHQIPFLALPHSEYLLADTAPGSPQQWFAFDTGMVGDPAVARSCYWIHALPCASPGKKLAALRLEPAGAGSVAVAGVTLFTGRHHPLRYRRLETYRVTLPPR